MSARNRIWTWTAVSAWIALTTAALVGGPVARRGRLPEPLASHWGASGVPDGAMSFGALLASVLVLWGAIAASGIAVLARGVRTRHQRGAAFSVLGAGAVFAVGVDLLTVWANLDVPDWRQARSLGWQLVPHLGLSALAGWLGWLLGRPGSRTASEPGDGTALTLGPRHHAVWVSTVSSRLLAGIGGGALVAGLATGAAGAWPVAVVAVLVGLPCLVLSSARVQIDERGVRTALGPLRWPVRRIRLAEIASATARTRSAPEVGGWGYRVLPATTAIMLRSGECLVLRLVSGRDFVVSADDAERGAELLNALLAERSAL